MTARGMITAAGANHTVQKLLALEGKIPSQGALCSSNFHFWQHWRRAVTTAQSPAELTPLVRTSRAFYRQTPEALHPASCLECICCGKL